MQHIIQANTSGNVLVVTHGMVIQAILREIREANISELWFDDEIEGTSLTVIEYSNNQYKEVTIGDISHQLSETC
jgi:probable phosphoglycerate mutase